VTQLKKSELLAWLRETADKAAREELHDVHDRLTQSADLIQRFVPRFFTHLTAGPPHS
jgi:hypothetical protein